MGASRRLANAAAACEEGEGTEATAATTVPVDLGTETASAPPMGPPGWRRQRPPRWPAHRGQTVASARRVTRKRAPGCLLASRRAVTCPAVGRLVACRLAGCRATGHHHVRCRAATLHAVCSLAACRLTAINRLAAGRLAVLQTHVRPPPFHQPPSCRPQCRRVQRRSPCGRRLRRQGTGGYWGRVLTGIGR